MIQEIPYKYDPAYKDKKPELTDYLLHYEYNKAMLLKEKEETMKAKEQKEQSKNYDRNT